MNVSPGWAVVDGDCRTHVNLRLTGDECLELAEHMTPQHPLRVWLQQAGQTIATMGRIPEPSAAVLASLDGT